MDAWGNFAVAPVGVSAAQAGLVFVGEPVNLARVLSLPGVPGRVGEALVVLLALLVAASALLVPGRSVQSLATALIAIGVVEWIAVVVTSRAR